VQVDRWRPWAFVAPAILISVPAGCGPTAEQAFRELAAPVLEARCTDSGCHGVGPGEPWPATEGLFFAVDAQGRIRDLPGARAAARSRIVTVAPPTLSSLVRVPLPAVHGGGPHWGGPLFLGPDDPALLDVVSWILVEREGSGGEDLELDALEARFGAEVMPVLLERCARGGCHGPTDVAFTAFSARPDPESGEMAPLDVRATRREVRKHLDLWSDDPARSRLVRKALGPQAGGIVHRGGPGTFFPEAPTDRPTEAPGLAAILAWAHAERGAMDPPGERTPTGLLYVQGPPATRDPFRIRPGPTGSDLYLAPWPPTDGPADNLTAPLHPEGPAEVRDPAVAHDGATVAFAMRRDGEADFALFELALHGRSVRRVSAADAPGSFVEPVYAPDGRLIAVWDGHGDPSDDGPGVPPELVAFDRATGAFERLTWTLAPEVKPAFLAAGKTRGMLVFATRRRGPAGLEGVQFRFPLCHDPALHGEPEYHVQFGASVAPLAPHASRDLPDGRQVVTLLDAADATDDRGALAVLDRALAPAVPDDAPDPVSVAGHRAPLAWLDIDPRWRDPVPLPDGRILVARDEPARPGEDVLHVLGLREGLEGPSLASTERLLSAPGQALRSPVPVVVRPPEDDDHAPVIDPAAPRGYFAIRDAAVLETLYGRPAPFGARPLRQDLRAVRALVPVHGRAEGLGAGVPTSILGEVDLADDHSAWLAVPARRPVLLQWLDVEGLVSGNQLHRWFYAQGEEVVPNGTNPASYAHVCSGCHGSLSGDPEAAAGPPPDAISAASVTLSTHEGRDPRKPIDPVPLPTAGEAVDYRSSIGPHFAEGCTGSGCHGGDAPAADLPLDDRPGAGDFPLAYERLLLEGYVDVAGRSARASPLVERLVGRALDGPWAPTGTCPPGGASPALVRRVAQWIETGAFYLVEPDHGP
jgi:hypothetical protein